MDPACCHHSEITEHEIAFSRKTVLFACFPLYAEVSDVPRDIGDIFCYWKKYDIGEVKCNKQETCVRDTTN
jgi:hypothetical protein